ncbi:MAG TPA: dephospho-CoA kinase [Bacteroidales bacterium]
MIKVGITGGIGSGKSTVCDVFRKLGIYVYVADERAKVLMNTDFQVKEKLISRFGQSIYSDNQLDRKLFAGVIFKDIKALEFVNSVVHPAVAIDFQKWSDEHKGEPYVLEEAALLFESGANKTMDKMITVYAPVDLRIKRAILRDGSTAALIKQRMDNQVADEEKVKYSDFVIYNDEKQSVIEQVMKLHNIFLSSNK